MTPVTSGPCARFCGAPLRAALLLAIALPAVALSAAPLAAQDTRADSARAARYTRDSAFVEGVERARQSPKVYHAEPIYVDLMRDLGARKGEAEWNVGLGQTDNLKYEEYLLFAEYEWAPRDRLGLEVELPIRLHTALERDAKVPPDQVESLKLAGMYTVSVDTVRHWSTAVGYLHEVLLSSSFSTLQRRPVDGNVFNPFLVTARRWGANWHTLLYAGPRFVRRSGGTWESAAWQSNWNLHYMVPGTRNFVGMEVNQSLEERRNNFVLRPQLRVGINDHFLVGIATGVPVNRERERVGTFIRLIYEPQSGNRH